MTVQVPVIDKANPKTRVAARVEEIVGRGFDVKEFVENFDVFVEATGGVKKLRELAIELATKGLLLDGVDRSLWRTMPLGDAVVDFQNGISKRRGDVGSPVPVLRLADIDGGVRLRQTDLREIVLTDSERQKYGVRRGDILVIRVNGSGDLVGRFIPCDTDRTWAYSDHLIRVRLSEELVDPAFLCAVSRSAAARAHLATRTVTTAGQKTINQQGLGSLPVLLPPLAEQKRIVAKVDQLMALCDDLEARQTKKRETGTRLTKSALEALTTAEGPEEFDAAWKRVVENFDVLFPQASRVAGVRDLILELAFCGRLVGQVPNDVPAQVRCNQLEAAWVSRRRKEPLAPVDIGERPASPERWSWVRLGNLAEIVGGVTKGRDLRGRTLNSYPYLRVANVQRGYLDLSTMKEIEIPEEELGKYLLVPGDLLFTEGGDWDKLGRSAVWRGEINECIHQNHVFRARVLGDLDPTWFCLYANSPLGRRYFENAAKQTTNLASINMTQLRGCPVPVPPLEEQKRIIAKIEQLMKMCDDLEARLLRAEDRAAKLVEAAVSEVVAG